MHLVSVSEWTILGFIWLTFTQLILRIKLAHLYFTPTCAVEISPGTGIYMGGLEAAIDGVLDGRYKPLDFRFFIGCCKYNKGELEAEILSNKYQPIACARALALKQCIQLPKPLWHEVMEMCGGELMEVSRLELKKRSDLSQE